MSTKKSNVSIRSKTSEATTKVITMKEDSVYDKWRPPPGIRYQLSETNVNFDAVVPRVKLKYTTVEYEPGQDLTVPVSQKTQKYAKQRGRGPVFKFQEEIDAERLKKIQNHLINTLSKHFKERAEKYKQAIQSLHDEIIHLIGPKWYHEMSPKQMNSADELKAAMMKDHQFETIFNTQETLSNMGLVLWPNHTKIEYALKKYYLCPIEFLLTIYRLNRPKDPRQGNEYTLNDRIILSAVVHLSIRDIFRELHLRIPSPPRSNEPPPPKPKVKQRKKRQQELPKIKWTKNMSPYLKPNIYMEQKHREGVYKNRHKEWPKLEYFDYVDDMYNVYFVDDPDSVVKRKHKKLKKSKWNRPPKIPVRFIESKMKKKKIYELKKPSPYISPCKINLENMDDEEDDPLKKLAGLNADDIVVNTNIDIANICCCSPQFFNKDTTFDLKIKITTSDEELHLMQKLCPYNSKNAIGDLKLVQQKKIKSSRGSTEDKPIKQIEYSCECCTCGKSINICPEISSVGPVKTLTSLREMVNSLNTIQEEGNAEELEEDLEDTGQVEKEPELEENFCKCASISEESSSTSSDDTFKMCTCKKSSDDCTCCICDQTNKDFLLKIKRYNEVNATEHRPCTCECKCKKKKKPPCCGDDTPPCKYCFCKAFRKKPEVEEEEEEQEPEEVSIKKETSRNSSKEHLIGDESLEDEQFKIEDPKICVCQKLYTNFLDAHESCMSLFAHYQQKIQDDIKEYLQDIKTTRCLCGDTDSSSNEMDEELLKYEHQELSSDSEACKCDKPPCDCGCTGDGDPFEGCTCGGPQVKGCTCDQSSSESSGTTGSSEDSERDSCCCTCGKGPCQCQIFLEKVRQMRECKRALAEQETAVAKDRKGSTLSKSKDEDDDDELDESVEEEETRVEEEPDPRIFVLEKFPKGPKKQQALLKMALRALAEDGYPMAMLPQVHRLPHFQVWLNKRCGKYISMEQREHYYMRSKEYWNHLDLCIRKVTKPKMPLPMEVIHHVTWGGVNTFKKIISVTQTDFRRRLKQAYIDQGQELFPTMCHYEFLNKSFRECYFSYLAADENHIFVFKPWEIHEKKDMSSRKPCS